MGDPSGEKLFFEGLWYGINTLKPENVLVYGGAEHYDWLKGRLPKGPKYHFYFSLKALLSDDKQDTRVERNSHKPGVRF